MLMLFLDSGSSRFGLDCQYVQEVVPQVELVPLYKVPDYVLGELNLRGVPIPVVSLGLLIGGEPERDRLHTRLVVIQADQEKERLIAIRAERVIQSDQVDLDAFVDPGVRTPGLPFLTDVMTTDEGQVQRLDVQMLGQFLSPHLYAEESYG